MAKFQRKADKLTRRRVWVLTIIFGVLTFAAVAVRLFQIQVMDHEFYQEKAVSLQTRDKVIYPSRGTIYDRNGKPLAISADTEMVTLEAKKIDDDAQRALIAAKLAELLGLDPETTTAMVEKRDSAYAVVKRGVEKDVADQLRAFIKENKLDSIYLFTDSTRYYPYGNFLSHVLGFVGSDEQGLAGLENRYEDVLSGTPGRIVTATNAKGEEMPFEYEVYYDAEDGDSLILTIDEVLQHYLEKNLEIAYKDNKVQQNTMGIVMDVNTGGILAMASYPDFDPNNAFALPEATEEALAAIADGDARAKARSDALYAQWNNKTISYTYYPGSTFKIITASSALEEGTVSLDSTFNCTGHKKVGVENIACWRYYRPHGPQSLADAICNSCNPAFIEIGLKLGAEKFSKYVTAFGLREKTGIDLPGEAVGLFNLKQEIDLAVYSFGQNFTITPLQLITAVSAVANGGTLLTPHVVKEIVDGDGNLVQSFERTEVRQVISAQTSATMADLLEGVVQHGTGGNAYTVGYRVAGKTGTTENIAKEAAAAAQGIEAEYRISSFVAFAPADNPQIAVLIVLDEPTVAPVTGGITVAPVIRRFMEEAMPYLNVDPVYTEQELQEKDVTVPDVTGLTYSEAESKLSDAGLQVRIEGEGDVVTDQLPRANVKVSSKAKAVLYLGGTAPGSAAAVPDLMGQTLANATAALQSQGLYIRVSGGAGGSGENSNIVITKQDVEAGVELTYGDVVTVEVSDLSQRAE